MSGTISIGWRVTNTLATPKELGDDPVGDVERVLAQHRGPEAWWAGGTFARGRRKSANWRAGVVVGVDVDYHDAEGAHAEMPDDCWSVVQAASLPGNLFHRTPRGVRVIFVLRESVDDPTTMRSVIAGAAALVERAIAGVVPGLAVDRACRDIARQFFGPRATVRGVERDAELIRLCSAPHEAHELAGHAPTTPERRPRARPASGPSEFDDAVARFNRAHPMHVPRSGGDCPMCGHRECFGMLADDPTRWVCFSASHGPDSGDIGLAGQSGVCWTGDALDLAVGDRRQAGEQLAKARARVLREDGYLAAATPQAQSPSDDLRTIRIASQEPPVVDAGIAVLGKNARGDIYQRGGALVHVGRVPDGAVVDGVLRPAGSTTIRLIEHSRVQELLSRSAMWEQRNKYGEWRLVRPPEWIGRRILARPAWPFQTLAAISEVPVLRPDGTILNTPGYDPRTGTLFDPCGVEFPAIAEAVTLDDARDSLACLSDLLEDFPFVSEADRAVALCGILAPFARNAIAGPVPMIAFGASTPGTGKSLLASVIGVLAAGRPMPAISPSSDSEEMRKGLLSLALSGDPLVLFDNIEGTFGSAPLAAALTSCTIRDRILGRTQHVAAPLVISWFATGNNIAWKGDLGRRVLPCDLDARWEHPEDRTEFRYPDLLRHAQQNRPKFVCAALTILRAHAVAGRPSHGGSRLGSFEAWDDVLRSAVVWVLGVDPCQTRTRIRESADGDLDELRSLLATWHALFGQNSATLAHAWEAAQVDSELGRELRGMLVSVAGLDGNALNLRAAGKRFASWLGRIAGGFRLNRVKGSSRIWRWAVELVEAGDQDQKSQAKTSARGGE